MEELACRVNLSYDTNVCDNLNNVRFKTICDGLDPNIVLVKEKYNFSESETYNFLLNSTNEVKDHEELELIIKVCRAEKDSQKLLSKLYAFRAPLSTAFTLVIVIFAGAWSDRHDIRKPFMVIPLFGRVLASGMLLASAVFMETIPAEYSVLGEQLIGALTGGYTLFIIGTSSYLTVTTSKENRTSRFGCLNMFTTILGVVASPLSGVLFKTLKYVEFFSLNTVIYGIGVFYVIFFIDEVKINVPVVSKRLSVSVPIKTVIVAESETSNILVKHKNKFKNLLLGFFDLRLISNSVHVLKRSRESNHRKILMFTIICETLFYTIYTENGLYILFTRATLKWTTEYGVFMTYMTAVGFLGSTIMTALFVNILKLDDPTLGIISLIGSLIAKPLIAFSTTTISIYIAIAIDLFSQVRYVAINSMISKIVDNDELGRAYSILGIVNSLDILILSPVYSVIYYHTIDFFPGAIFLFSEIFLGSSLIIFIVLKVLWRHVHILKENPVGENPNTCKPTRMDKKNINLEMPTYRVDNQAYENENVTQQMTKLPP